MSATLKAAEEAAARKRALKAEAASILTHTHVTAMEAAVWGAVKGAPTLGGPHLTETQRSLNAVRAAWRAQVQPICALSDGAVPFARFVYPLDQGLVEKLVGRARLCLTAMPAAVKAISAVLPKLTQPSILVLGSK